MSTPRPITVYGASGHTGRFVVAELHRRGRPVVLAGRNGAAMRTVADAVPGSEVRLAAVDDPTSLDAALAGAAAVINCAGPFVDTAAPIVDAALRAGAHYLDVTAEQAIALATLERGADPAERAGLVVLPAMAFYGGLGDLLATAAVGDWPDVDEVRIGIWLDRWWPTKGTRLTGRTTVGRKVAFANGRFVTPADPAPTASWPYPPPLGAQDVVAVPTADIVTISRHIRTPEITVWMNRAPLADLGDPETPAPEPADDSGRSAQRFVVDVVVRRGAEERRATATGRDIYAVTAPLVVEAAERIVDGRALLTGALAAGELFDAADFLEALSSDLSVSTDLVITP